MAFGRLVALPEATILYRRHEVNAAADPYGDTLSGALRRTLLAPRSAPAAARKAGRASRNSSPVVCGALSRPLKGYDVAALEAFARLPSLGLVERRLAVVRHGLWFASPLKNAGLMALL